MLLLGGQGTLAQWTGNTSVQGGSLKIGALTIATPNCTWVLTRTGGTLSGTPSSGPTAPYTGQPLQPHDIVTGTCTTTVVATGDHIKGHLVPSFATTPAAPLSVSVSPTATAGATFGPGTTAATVTTTLTVPDTASPNPSADSSNAWNATSLQIRAVQDTP